MPLFAQWSVKLHKIFIRSVLNKQMSGSETIEWPDLDVDLEIDSLQHPERYPLVIKRNQLDFVG